MRINEVIETQELDEDLRKWVGGAVAAGALAAAPVSHLNHQDTVQHAVATQPSDARVLQQTLWGEARNGGRQGMLAIGHVIKNRLKDTAHSRLFGQGIKGIVMKNKQFSCWNKNDPNYKLADEMKKIDQAMRTKSAPGEGSYDAWLAKFKQSPMFNEYQSWREAGQVAHDVLAGKSTDPTHGATYYHTTAVHPSWTKDLSKVGKIGAHIFYRLPSSEKGL